MSAGYMGRLNCRLGRHDWRHVKSEDRGTLVLHVWECSRCGLRRGEVAP